MKRLITSIFLASMLAISATCTHTNSHATEPARQASPISLEELHERGVNGRLGVPLGTIIHITGTVIEIQSLSKAIASEPFFLRVETVNGQTLAVPQTFAASDMFTTRDMPKHKVGDRFKYTGYERGGFGGEVDGEFEYRSSMAIESMPAMATTGFGFSIEFIVLKAD